MPLNLGTFFRSWSVVLEIGKYRGLLDLLIGIRQILFSKSKSSHLAVSTSLFLAPVKISIGMMYLDN